MINQFLTCCGDDPLLQIDNNQDCTSYVQKYAQLSGLIILPKFAPRPSDWTDVLSWGDSINNSLAGSEHGKYIVGEGEIPAHSLVVDRMGKQDVTLYREYELALTVKNLSAAQYEFLRRLQCSWLDFSFWYETVAGRLFGGPDGIKPLSIDVDFIHPGGRSAKEVSVVKITWRADGAPERADVTGFSGLVDTVTALGPDTEDTIVFGPEEGGTVIFGF